MPYANGHSVPGKDSTLAVVSAPVEMHMLEQRPQVDVGIFKELSLLDRLLTPLILIAMIVGVVIGEFAPQVRSALNTVQFHSVSVPIAIGLIVMIWPVLVQVQYETLPKIFSSSRIWIHVGISMILNWIIGPAVMLGLAWICLPDLPTYRTGVLMVGIARCIAMVMIWNNLAKGDSDYGAILVVINASLQIILYSPYCLLFINVFGPKNQPAIHVAYDDVAISVLIYLGMPLAAAIFLRYSVWYFTSKQFLDNRFIPWFSPLAQLGLLYTILILFAYQGHQIIRNIGHVFRVLVPLVLYFFVMWTSTFVLIYKISRRNPRNEKLFGYEMAVTQAFTAASNNFELAIAVAIAVYGIDSEQALATSIGPMAEVPVLLALSWFALYLRRRLDWTSKGDILKQST